MCVEDPEWSSVVGTWSGKPAGGQGPHKEGLVSQVQELGLLS